MSKMLIIKGCMECPNFIRSTSPKDFTVSCKKIGKLGSPLNYMNMDYPCECPLADASQKDDTLDKIRAEIEMMNLGESSNVCIRAHNNAIHDVLRVIDKYRKVAI